MDPQPPFSPVTPPADQVPPMPPSQPPVEPTIPLPTPVAGPTFAAPADQTAAAPLISPPSQTSFTPSVPVPAETPVPATQQLQSLYGSSDATTPAGPPMPGAVPQTVPTQPLSPPPQSDVVPSYENIYTEICAQIIKEQARIIGNNLAIEQASHVQGLAVDPETLHCTVVGNGSKVINDLIEEYSDFFGHAAIEVCREAASRFLVNLSVDQTPALLRAA